MTMPKKKNRTKIIILIWILMLSVNKNTAYAQKENTDRADSTVSQVIVDVQGINGDVSRWVDLVKRLIFILIW